jgi:hypothetical protein
VRVSAAYLERVARDWQDAYCAAHQKPAPHIVWERGWFRIVDGGYRPKYRRAKLEQMTATLKNFTPP